MGLTFDEAYQELKNNVKYKKINADVVNYIFDKLREEYAPTVEMTSGNKATFMQEGDSLSKLLTDYYGFDVLYWGDVSERKVAQAWLHPETIKIVDNEEQKMNFIKDVKGLIPKNLSSYDDEKVEKRLAESIQYYVDKDLNSMIVYCNKLPDDYFEWEYDYIKKHKKELMENGYKIRSLWCSVGYKISWRIKK